MALDGKRSVCRTFQEAMCYTRTRHSRPVPGAPPKSLLFAENFDVLIRTTRQAGVAEPLRWSSCSETTGGPPTRSAAMARAAAMPLETVVMQGTPRATAARRIS